MAISKVMNRIQTRINDVDNKKKLQQSSNNIIDKQKVQDNLTQVFGSLSKLEKSITTTKQASPEHIKELLDNSATLLLMHHEVGGSDSSTKELKNSINQLLSQLAGGGKMSSPSIMGGDPSSIPPDSKINTKVKELTDKIANVLANIDPQKVRDLRNNLVKLEKILPNILLDINLALKTRNTLFTTSVQAINQNYAMCDTVNNTLGR